MAKDEKRQATLADMLVLNQPRLSIYDPKTVDHIRLRVRGARRFVFDAEASRRVGEVVREVPELLYREQQFARAPYDLTWIEYDAKAFWRAANEREPDAKNAPRLGFLIDHGTVYAFVDGLRITARGTDQSLNTGPIIQPFVYDLHRPWSNQEELEFAEQCWTSRGQLSAFTWGSSLIKVPKEQQRLLRDVHTIRTIPMHPKLADTSREIYGSMMKDCVGDLRTIIALLLLMNRPSVTTYVRDVPHWRTFVKGKLRPYMSHSVVNIAVDPVPTVRKIGTLYGETVAKRRHEVRGVYCHDEAYRKGTKAGCIHEWIEHPDYVDEALSEKRWHKNAFGVSEFDNWKCTRCHGHRWWRATHQRGDAGLGYVTKTYEVQGQ